MFDLLLFGVFAAVGTALAWWGGSLLVEASDRLGAYYGLPTIVQGAVIAAVGSSFPELSSVVISTVRYGEFELGIGAVIGSAMFNILVIPSLSALAGEGSLASNRDLVYKEAQFYLLALAVLLLTFSFAVIYYPIDGGLDGGLTGEVTRPLALLPVGLYGLYLFIQYHDSVEYETDVVVDDLSPVRQWVALGFSLLVILASAELLVRAAVGFGEAFGTSTFLWGMTVVAAGTSLPDTFVSVAAARAGNASMSLANVFGSNIFALLVVLPAGVFVAGGAPIAFVEVVPMMGVLTLASLAFFAVLRTDMRLTRGESQLLLGVYAVFVAWLFVEGLGLSSLLPGV